MQTHILFKNHLLAFALLFTYIIGSAQREAPKSVDIKHETTTTSSAFNSKGTPAKIKDSYGIWTDFNLRTKAGADKLRAQIGDALFEQIANNCNETSGWPGAITSYEERNKVRDQMAKYVCYQIAEIDDKWILRVPASENTFLPYGVRPEHDIFFAVGKNYVELTGDASNTTTGSSSYTSTPSAPSYTSVSTLKGPRAKIKDSMGLWTDFILRSKADASQVRNLLGNMLFEEVANNCNEKLNWPSGISSYEQREKVRPEMKDYVCYQIGESDDKWILRVPASENSFQPYNMRPTRDIYFMVRKSDVDLSGSPINTLSSHSYTPSTTASTSSSSYYSKGEPAKINATGGMYSTFNLATETKAAYLKDYWGSTDFDDVAKYCREENWPSGIKDLTARDKVRSQMNDYKAYKIAGFDGKYILRIPADENKFMPYDMRPTHDIFFVINQTDVTLGGSKSSTNTITNNYKPSGTSSGAVLAFSTDDIGKKVYINGGATISSDLTEYDTYEDIKSQVSAADYPNVLKYSKQENWPSGLATETARQTNSSHFSDYKAVIAGHFEDDYYTGYYLLKLTSKANTHVPANMRPTNTIYLIVDELDVSLE